MTKRNHRTNKKRIKRDAKRDKKRKKKTTKSHSLIIDPEFSNKTHKGTQASSAHCELCERSYHYQSYATFTDYIEILLENDRFMYVYSPPDYSDMTLEMVTKKGD